jgi:hypothetical protein
MLPTMERGPCDWEVPKTETKNVERKPPGYFSYYAFYIRCGWFREERSVLLDVIGKGRRKNRSSDYSREDCDPDDKG